MHTLRQIHQSAGTLVRTRISPYDRLMIWNTEDQSPDSSTEKPALFSQNQGIWRCLLIGVREVEMACLIVTKQRFYWTP
jgi:hypothetical protein